MGGTEHSAREGGSVARARALGEGVSNEKTKRDETL